MPRFSTTQLQSSSKDQKGSTPRSTHERRGKPVRTPEHHVLRKLFSIDRRVCVSAGVLVPFLALLSFLVIWGLWTLLYVDDDVKNEAVCGTADCLAHAFKIGLRLDHNKKPCDDFTALVCSAWEPKSRGITTRDVAEGTHLDWLAELTDRLKRNSLRLQVDSKLQAMYRSCVGRIRDDHKATIQIARTFMADRGLSWPDKSPANVSALVVLVELAVDWVTPIWFEIRLLPATESRPRMIQIGHSALVDTQYRLLRTITDYDDLAYRYYWSSFYDAFATAAPDRYNKDKYEADLNRQVVILRSLYQVRRRHISFVTSLGSMPNSSNWIIGLSKVYKLADPVSADDKIFVTDKHLLDAIHTILNNFSNDELIAHISWTLAQMSGIVAFGTLFSTLLGGEDYALKFLPLMCSGELEVVYHQLFMESTAEANFPMEEREALGNFLGQITEEAIVLINSSKWLDEGSKHSLIWKIRETTTNIWPSNSTSLYNNFPDNEPYFVSYWVETRRSTQTIPITTDYGWTLRRHGLDAALTEYNYLLNAIQLSVASLRPPFYYRRGTKAMMYAGIGFLYASLIVHAFDENGICFGASGYSGAPEFPLETRKTYVRKAFCGTSNSNLVLCAQAERNSSIFPYLPALQIAYAGFKKALALEGDLRLKNFEGYTPEQVFFITLCHTTCFQDPFSAVSWGCNEFVRHFPPFAEAFNCPLLSGMNPQERCETF